jgi:hypothetical protein
VDGEVEVRVFDAAARFIRDRGGSLYVWDDLPGSRAKALVQWATEPPGPDVEFDHHEASGIAVHVEPSLFLGRWVEVRLRRIPYRRLDVAWQFQVFSPARSE